MRGFFIFFLGLLLAGTASAVASQRAVIVSYPPETPDYVVNEAMEVIIKAGGVITHEYELIKGFAARASSKALEMVSELTSQFPATIEEDAIVSVNGQISEVGGAL